MDAASPASAELMWIISYALQYMWLIWVWLFILAWMYYIMSLDNEDWANKAKAILKNVAIGTIIIIISYTLVSTFVPN